jgi:hypothetical protein
LAVPFAYLTFLLQKSRPTSIAYDKQFSLSSVLHAAISAVQVVAATAATATATATATAKGNQNNRTRRRLAIRQHLRKVSRPADWNRVSLFHWIVLYTTVSNAVSRKRLSLVFFLLSIVGNLLNLANECPCRGSESLSAASVREGKRRLIAANLAQHHAHIRGRHWAPPAPGREHVWLPLDVGQMQCAISCA